jgi:L-fuculose-phosphate aldolase
MRVTAERNIIRWGRVLFRRRLVSGWGGNLSCRLGPNEILITGQHAPLGFLKPADLVRIDESGKPLDANRRASSETPMHLAVYRGSDASAIVHAHPPLVVAFSLGHDSFVPISFEEKYTIGEVPIIVQETPTVTEPEKIVAALKYRPVAIIKGHGSVAIGKNLEEAFLITDLLEEAVRCRLATDRGSDRRTVESTAAASHSAHAPDAASRPALALFSAEHMQALVERANRDAEFREHGRAGDLSTSLTLELAETRRSWTVTFRHGEIVEWSERKDGLFMISGKAEWWKAVFGSRIDPFLATQQGKLRLERGELAQLSRWYKPFQRAFSLWQTIPVE